MHPRSVRLHSDIARDRRRKGPDVTDRHEGPRPPDPPLPASPDTGCAAGCLITSEASGEVVVVHVAGEVDVDGAACLRHALASAVGSGFVNLVVDLRAVTFIDSTGLGVLVNALRSARRLRGRLEIVVRDPRLVRLLRISSLDQLFVVHDDLTTALLPTQRPGEGP
jgi:anti-sigma B factor antagonist